MLGRVLGKAWRGGSGVVWGVVVHGGEVWVLFASDGVA